MLPPHAMEVVVNAAGLLVTIDSEVDGQPPPRPRLPEWVLRRFTGSFLTGIFP